MSVKLTNKSVRLYVKVSTFICQSAGGALGAISPDILPAVLPLPTQICVNRPLPAPRATQSPTVCPWKECMLERSIS